MLSILIPVYNFDVTTLVFDLHDQMEELAVAVEIIVMEDGSTIESLISKNKEISDLAFCQYYVLKENTGRSHIRNTLAAKAKYEYLLFIDGDSLIPKNYLKNCISSIDKTTEVIYGGRVHPPNYADKSNLRWQYGTKVEDKTAKERAKTPYRSTIYNNTVVKKTVFNKVTFDRGLTNYGHEDTLLSWQLKRLKVDIEHLENPVIHGEIDTNKVFLKKTISGLENLKVLYQSNKIGPDFVKIIKVHRSLKSIGLAKALGYFYSIFKNPMFRNLSSEHPSLLVFHVFKLSYFCKINEQQ